MNNSLFLDPSISLEKVAYDTRIDDDVEEWPTAVVREAYKQLPFLKSYETEVELEKIDSARGYGVGKMLVWPARMEKGAAAQGKQLISVPVVIRNREMAPLDVYSYRDSMMPMDQNKVAEALFRPEMFERAAPRDQFTGTNLFGQLTPPNTDHQYNAGTLHKHGHAKKAAASDAPNYRHAEDPAESCATCKFWVPDTEGKGHCTAYDFMCKAEYTCDAWAPKKSVAKTANVLHRVKHTFRVDDIDAFAEKLAADHGVRYAFLSYPELHSALTELSQVSEKTASDKREDRQASLRPTVVQFRATSGGSFLCKTANHRCFAPQEQEVSRFEAQKVLSKVAFARLMDTGRVTLSVDPTVTESSTEKTAQDVNRVGRYQVLSGGRTVEGIGIPRVVDFDGQDLGYQLFVGDGSHAMQEKVAGVFLEDVKVESDHPSGLGVFVYQEGGQALAYEPVRIDHKVKIAGHTQFAATRMSNGVPIRISVVPGLQKAASLGGTEIALPETVRFLALGKSTRVSSTPEDVQALRTEKTAAAHSVKLVSDGRLYSLRGENSKLAFADGFLLDHEAEFALGALGLTGSQARDLMKTAAACGEAVATRTRPVLTEAARGFEAMQKAASAVNATPALRVDLSKELAALYAPKAQALWKQASVVLSKDTADTILSLGFVTPENASLYVNYLPDLEKTAEKLAELLVASRLGMDDLRESAAKNAMTQVNAVIRGLESLRERIH